MKERTKKLLFSFWQNPYFKLIRLHYSVGTALLLLPAILGIIIGYNGEKSMFIPMLQVTIGAFLARSAGCVINDIIDRNLDKKVERTKNRPLAAGLISVEQALICLTILLLGGFAVLFTLPLTAQMLSVIFFLPVFIYPCSKYFSKFPQFFLAPLFSSGVLIGFATMRDTMNAVPISFFFGCFFWVIFYDTVYAHQDKKFDQQVGVNSTALTFGIKSFSLLKNFLNLSFLFWTIGTLTAQFNRFSLIGYGILWYLANDKFCRTNLENPAECKKIFKFSMKVLFFVCLINLFGNMIRIL